MLPAVDRFAHPTLSAWLMGPFVSSNNTEFEPMVWFTLEAFRGVPEFCGNVNGKFNALPESPKKSNNIEEEAGPRFTSVNVVSHPLPDVRSASDPPFVTECNFV